MDAPCLALILKISWFWTPPPPTLMDGYLTAKFCKLMRVQHTCKPDKSSYPSIQRRRREDYQDQEGKSKTLSNLNLLIKKKLIICFLDSRGDCQGKLSTNCWACWAVVLSFSLTTWKMHTCPQPISPAAPCPRITWFLQFGRYFLKQNIIIFIFLIILMCEC